ncbi:unnamed protein product [Lactuca virosa]|uniref:Secreted protein n=1 Tax=Lactuca virosa TaxID=75947 RepID=A0AAU9LDV6_9ASTR|nr:unnamed protein product [Lactuca virosa]
MVFSVLRWSWMVCGSEPVVMLGPHLLLAIVVLSLPLWCFGVAVMVRPTVMIHFESVHRRRFRFTHLFFLDSTATNLSRFSVTTMRHFLLVDAGHIYRKCFGETIKRRTPATPTVFHGSIPKPDHTSRN